MDMPIDIPAELDGILARSPDILSGAVRFVGTRVLVQALFDTILCGKSVEYFLEDFPEVNPDHAHAVVAWEQNKVRASLGLDKAS